MKTDLSKFDTGNYKVGAGKLKVLSWYLINNYMFNSPLPWPGKFKLSILRAFGAKVGTGIVLKPGYVLKTRGV